MNALELKKFLEQFNFRGMKLSVTEIEIQGSK